MKVFLKTHSVKVYIGFFLGIAFILLSGLSAKLYFDAKTIKEQTYQKNVVLAKTELNNNFNATLLKLKKELNRIAHWDEAKQQLDNPSYYYYWHDERLKSSSYWHLHFDQVEIYDANKHIILPQKKTVSPSLPNVVPHLQNYVQFTQDHAKIVLFSPVLNGHKKIKGYIGLSADLTPLLKQQPSYFLSVKSLMPIPNTNIQVPLSETLNYFKFKPVTNPVNDFLWGLIQNFLKTFIIFATLIFLLFYLFFRLTTLIPLREINKYLNQLKVNAKRIVAPPKKMFLCTEMENMKQSLQEYNISLIHSQDLIEQQRQKAEKQSLTDALSGLQNRRTFDQKLDFLMAQHYQRALKNVGFLLFDCDYFKAINDTYGHATGNAVIQISAQILQTTFTHDMPVYRIGGNEFAVIAENKTLDECYQLAEKVFNKFNGKNFTHLGIVEKISFSIGISCLDKENTPEISQLHPHADIALYQAKQSIHQKIKIFDASKTQTTSSLISTDSIHAITEALTTGKGIQMHFQPLLTPDRVCDYYESLIRISTDKGLIYPGEIFEIISHRHLELELDIQVINNIAHQLSFNDRLIKTGVSINLSANALLDANLNQYLAPLLPYTQKTKLVIEVLENTYIENMAQITNTLQSLKKDGFYIALDDFGSGYSSIRYLASMPVDIIKFDITLTQALISDPKTENIIKSTAKMILAADYKLVMEGIETEALCEAAIAAGATHLQGFLFGKPSPNISE